MKVLIIGLGSIARKHIKAIETLCVDTEIFALRSKESAEIERGIKNVYDISAVADLDFVIISNPTALHFKTINTAISLKVPLFIEKPPLMNLKGADQLLKKIEEEEIITYVAFNLRFHPVLIWLKKYLDGKRILEVIAYCGSYLPDWRPNVDYSKTYSADKDLGGGVHLDLIHEIDYLIWLLGPPNNIINQHRRLSDLSINSVDFATYLLNYDQSIALIILNYFRRDTERTVQIVFDDHSIKVDLIKGLVQTEGGKVLFECSNSTINTYVDQMKYFINCINSKRIPNNSLKEGLETLKFCLNE